MKISCWAEHWPADEPPLTDLSNAYGIMPYRRQVFPRGSTMDTSARFDLRLESGEKELFAEAAALMGTSMAAFVRAAAKEKARVLLERERRIALSPRDMSALAAALGNAFAPNKALRAAIRRARETVRRA